MAKSTQYLIQAKEELTAQLRIIEAKLATTNEKLGDMQKAGEKAFDTAKVTAYGAIAVAVLSKVIDFGAKAVKAYGDFEEKSLRLTAQLRVSGNQIGMTAAQIMDLASALESATGIDDGDILNAVSALQTFQNVTGATFKEAVTQATNMSVVFGDVDTAARQLGAALDDPANNLDKLHKASIYFTDAEKEQISVLQKSGDLLGAQAIVLDKVRGKFDGLAESMNVGVNGSLKSLANNWDDTMKAMGESFTEWVKPAIDAMSQGLANLNANNPKQMDVGQAKKALTDVQNQLKTMSPVVTGGSLGAMPNLAYASLVDRKNALEKQIRDLEAADRSAAFNGGNLRLTAPGSTPEAPKSGGALPAWLAPPGEQYRGTDVTGGPWSQAEIDYQAEADAAQKVNDEYIAGLKEAADEGKRIARDRQEALAAEEAGKRASVEREKEDQRQLFEVMTTGWSQVSQTWAMFRDMKAQDDQAAVERMRSDLKEYTSAQDLKIEVAKRLGKDTTQMEVDRANEVAEKQGEIREAERKAKREAWAANKASSLANIAMSGAEAVVKAWTLAPPFNFIMAGMVAATTAAQLGIVGAQQMPKFASGGIVPGSSLSGDNVLARLNSREMVLNLGQQSRLLAIADGGAGGGPRTTIVIDKVYGSVDQAFLDNLNREQDVRKYRGVS